MATETREISPHLRGVTVTTVSTLFGLIGGVASSLIASGPNDTFGISILAVAILAQLPIFQAVGIDVNDFSKKDHLYVIFMTFSLWFITWGILLTAGSL